MRTLCLPLWSPICAWLSASAPMGLLFMTAVSPSVATAAPFAVSIPAGLDPDSGHLARWVDADLQILSDRVLSRHGIRKGGSDQPFAPSYPMVYDQALEVQGASGKHFTLVVSPIDREHALVELSGDFRDEHPQLLPTAQRFHASRIWLDDELTAAVYPDLVLMPDGTYRFGGVRDAWSTEGDGLALGGYYKSWGTGVLSPQRENVTFRFARGSHHFQIMFERVMENEEPRVAWRP